VNLALDFTALPPEQLVAIIVATSFAAGLNVYATVVTLGLLAQFNVIVLPPALGAVGSWWMIGAGAALFAIEFVADKIPAVDLVWNALHTFVRVPIGALLAFGAATPLSPEQQALAGIAGGLLAFLAHGGKTAARAAVSLSPEPFSNAALSLGEDVVAIGLTWFAVRHPYVAASIAILSVIVILVLARAMLRALRALFRGATRRVA
jgi:hypothetical protein